jgi:hypothetical protein
MLSAIATAATATSRVQVLDSLTNLSRGALTEVIKKRGQAALQGVPLFESMTDSVRRTTFACSWV